MKTFIRRIYEWSYSAIAESAIRKYAPLQVDGINVYCPQFTFPVITRTLHCIKEFDENRFSFLVEHISNIYQSDERIAFGYVARALTIKCGGNAQDDCWTDEKIIWTEFAQSLLYNAILSEAYQQGLVSMLFPFSTIKAKANSISIDFEKALKMNIEN